MEGEERQADRVGTTEDVSAGGVFFRTAEWQGLELGKKISVRLSGLSGYGTGPLFRSLRANATILRLAVPGEERHPYEKAGMAARFSERPCFEVYRWSE